MNWIVEILIFLIIITILIFINERKIKNKNKKKLDISQIPENDYQNYAKFYGKNIPIEENYQIQMNIIYDLIVNNNEKNIKKISKKTQCNIDECILKIRYLKTKDLIDNYVIDNLNYKLIETSFEEKTLVLKYSDYLYKKNLQIKEIAEIIPRNQGQNIQQIHQKIYNDLISLYNKSLLDNLIINKETGYINYYINKNND